MVIAGKHFSIHRQRGNGADAKEELAELRKKCEKNCVFSNNLLNKQTISYLDFK